MKLVRLLLRSDLSFDCHADSLEVNSLLAHLCVECGMPINERQLRSGHWNLVMPSERAAVFAVLGPRYAGPMARIVWVRKDLNAVIGEYACGVGISDRTYGDPPAAFHLWFPLPNQCLRYRDIGAFYFQCETCGQLCGQSGLESVVRRSVEPNQVYLDDTRQIVMDRDLWDRLEIGKRFPKLRGVPVRVTDEPEDGETLPGDPGWDGTLRPRFTSVPQRERILEQERLARRKERGRKPKS